MRRIASFKGLPRLYSVLKHAEFHAVASSDATNIRTSIKQEGDKIVINGHKW